MQLAQINVARMVGINIDDPIMKEFVDNLDRINHLAENSPGFVWRLKDDNNNATKLNPFNDEQVIINVSVWDTVEDLKQFVYKSAHSEFMKRRKEWFKQFGKMHMALWWIEDQAYPSIEESISKLELIQRKGATHEAFDFRNIFDPKA